MAHPSRGRVGGAASQRLLVEPFGDTAVVIQPAGIGSTRAGIARLRAIANAVAGPGFDAVSDAVPSPDRVTVVYDPLQLDSLDEFLGRLRDLADTAVAGPPAAAARHVLPVCYGGDQGPDLAAVCRHHGIGRETLIRLHTSPDYLVTAIGFVPGFPYLAGLSERLATPRLASPRTEIPAGSVGIGGSQTGVYPFATPGGWRLIGRTGFSLFDAAASPAATLAVGDLVRFRETAERPAAATAAAPTSRVPRPPIATVLEPGLMTTVQDGGRPRQRAAGVPKSGAADLLSARLANLVVGNPESAAVLEFTLIGPSLQFEADALIGIVGTTVAGPPTLRPLPIRAGTRLKLGHLTAGCRGYLAIAGGIDVPAVLGSRSTYAPAGFGGVGGRPLRAGDGLTAGFAPLFPTSHRWSLDPRLLPLPPCGSPCRLRFIPATVPVTRLDELTRTAFPVTASSNRMGLRFEGGLPQGPAAGISRAVLPGTLQLPPDGNPILLLADAQTIGGYAVLGQVIAADLPLAGQLRPGDSVQFEPTTIAAAHRLLRRQQAQLATVRDGVAARFRPAEPAGLQR